ncbi:MAG: transglutaminase-like domain-containing protein [Geobacteraceae bacterium]|nr:transglutaminase-like domain-containing protein [Geobacteraceae bacterium]
MSSFTSIFHNRYAAVPVIFRSGLVLMLLLVSLLFAVTASARTFPPLSGPPLGERWFGIYFSDERTGFVHLRITPAATGYLIESESSVKMSGFGFSREASVRESYLVNPDLTLQSFTVSQTIDGSPITLTGQVGGKTISVVTDAKGTRKEKTLPVKGRVYPPAALNFYPLLQKVTAGKKYRVAMLDPEAVAVKNVLITVLGIETDDGRDVLHLRNDLYPFVDNDIWVDPAGNTIRESVRDGWIETRAEDEATGRALLAEAAIAKKDMILDFSLVPIDRPIERPAGLSAMTLELAGFAENLPLLTGPLQKAERLAGQKVLFTTDLSSLRAAAASSAEVLPEPNRYLASGDRILADNAEIIRRKTEILCGTEDPRAAVEKLVRWVADTVADTVSDSRSPLETLEQGSGNCLSHARLYVSLARAAGVPTRSVSGLVYVEGKGFLYHSWAESFVGYWLPVDPTFGEVPANATHIKLVEGDAPDDMAPLASIIGTIRGRVVDLKYQKQL